MAKTLLYFSGGWCAPCRMMSPIIDELSSEFNISKIDVDQNPTMAEKYDIRSIPAFIVLNESGQEVSRKVGAQSKNSIKNMLL